MEIHSRRFRVPISVFGLISLAGGYAGPGFPQSPNLPAKLTYSRTFKGSTPEYLAITVDAGGSGTYEGRKLDEAQSQSPRTFQLSAGTTGRVFALAGQLGDFRSLQLESHKKVANMGEKILTYQ